MVGGIEPVHRSFVAVDVEGSDARTDPERLAVRKAIYALLREALRGSGITEDQRVFVDRGDGVLIVVDPGVPKTALLAELVPMLTALMHEVNLARVHRLRFRVAMHAGEVLRDDHGYVGASLATTYRLLGSAELRAALQLTDVDLAMAVTESFYQTVIAHGARGIDPSVFRKVLVKAKGITFPARVRAIDPPQDPPPTPPAAFGSGDLHHVCMFLVDIENYGTRPDKIKGVLRAELRRMTTAAIAHAGLTPVLPPDDAGDSLCFVFGPGTPKNRLIDPLIPALTRELVTYNANALPEAQFRLRAVVDSGELYRDHKFFGTALDDAYGMLNSHELRDSLRRHPEWPFALMVSHEVYDGVVRHAYGDIDPAGYAPMTVFLKQRDVRAWVHGPDETSPDQ
jgi:hypothetical protein